MDIEKSINISDNLRVWMLGGEMKQAELAEYLGMIQGMMSQRLMGVKKWRDEDVERISKLMNVSEEKLVQPSALGETLRRFEKSRKNPSYRKNFGGRLNRLAGKKGKTIRELSAELGMDYSGICKWVMGSGLPSAFALVKIANYFGMTAAQLAGFEPEAAEPEQTTAEKEPETACLPAGRAKAEPEAVKTEPEAVKTEPEAVKTEPEEEKTGKCRTVDERREMFRDRLRELIERSGKTPEEIARDTEIGLPLMQGYLEGRYFPGYLMAQKLADYFDVSTEVLSGEAEMPEPEEEKAEPDPGELIDGDFAKFGQRLSELIRRSGAPGGEAAYKIGIGLPLWELYVQGHAMPGVKIARRIAEYFGVSVAVLLGDEELPEDERGEHDDEKVPAEERIAARAAAEGNCTLAADIIIGRAEKVKLTELDVDKVINGLAREVAEYDAYHAWVAGKETVNCPGAILVAIAALRKLRPARVGVFEPGRGKCPVCGEIVSEDCPICPHCLQRLSWELGCGDEVYMSADPECRFWVGGKEENGFVWGYDMSFRRCCEHPADLVRSGRHCPELARGLEAAAKL